MYQTRIQDYEVQAMAAATLIKQLKKEKEATEDKVKKWASSALSDD